MRRVRRGSRSGRLLLRRIDLFYLLPLPPSPSLPPSSSSLSFLLRSSLLFPYLINNRQRTNHHHAKTVSIPHPQAFSSIRSTKIPSNFQLSTSIFQISKLKRIRRLGFKSSIFIFHFHHHHHQRRSERAVRQGRKANLIYEVLALAWAWAWAWASDRSRGKTKVGWSGRGWFCI